MKLRSLLFWSHLAAGVLAGVVILVMCVTGVLLTYERQLIAWADRGYQSLPSGDARMLPVGVLLDRFRAAHPDLTPVTVTVRSDDRAAVAVGVDRRTLYLDRYSGVVLGEASAGGVRRVMADLRAWHRWLAVAGDGRSTARAITGWSNVLFLFIVMSGVYLWFPRKWTAALVRKVVLFNPTARGKARDFNWHNVIGSWCAVPLFIVVLSAIPISFGWANALVYRAVGEVPPAGGARRPPTPASQRPAAPMTNSVSLDALWTQAESRVPGWRSVSLRVPAPGDPLVFAIDRGDGGQPHLRSTLTVDPRTGREIRFESFSDQTPGRRIRTTMRFAHTGEVLGVAGQTVAGIASAGGAVLVWTGLALAWRRFRAWGRRRDRQGASARIPSAA